MHTLKPLLEQISKQLEDIRNGGDEHQLLSIETVTKMFDLVPNTGNTARTRKRLRAGGVPEIKPPEMSIRYHRDDIAEYFQRLRRGDIEPDYQVKRARKYQRKEK